MPRPIVTEDTDVLLEEHRLERLEADIRAAIVDLLVHLLDPCCGPDCEDRPFYRYQLGELWREERRIQALNGTLLVLDCPTYDAENGSCDEQAEVLRADLQRLSMYGICIPESACLVDESKELSSDWYAEPGLMPRWI